MLRYTCKDTPVRALNVLVALANGKREDFHVFDLTGSTGADVMIADSTALSYV